jgi:hypothetical protein
MSPSTPLALIEVNNNMQISFFTEIIGKIKSKIRLKHKLLN